MRTVADVLANKTQPTNIVAPQAMVIDALKMMQTQNLSYVIVMDGDEFKGIFGERNYARQVALDGKSSSTYPVSEAMSKQLTPITPEHTVEECIELILAGKCRYLPVFQDEHLEGVITIHDILREALRSKEALFDATLADRLIDEGAIY